MVMKKIWTLLLCGLLFIGCFDDENIHAEYVDYGRIYDTTSTDPVMKYISQYYYKYDKFLIVDPDTADYMFNFQSKNRVYIVKPKQETESLLKRLKFLEEIFLLGYNDDVKKNLFPNTIMLADTIYNLNKEEYVDMYLTGGYIAFRVNDATLNMSEAEKVELSRRWNKEFLDYCTKKIGWTVPEEFYLYRTDDEYREKKNWWIPIPGATEDEPADINIVWERGYPVGTWYAQFDPWPDKVWGYMVPSSREQYLTKFYEFLFTTPQEIIDKAISDHVKLKKPHDVLDQALKDDFGIDYRTMVYKAKK